MGKDKEHRHNRKNQDSQESKECRQTKEKLSAAYDYELSSEEIVAIHQKIQECQDLEGCFECQDLEEAFRAISHCLKIWKEIYPSEVLDEKIKRFVRNYAQGKHLSRNRSFGSLSSDTSNPNNSSGSNPPAPSKPDPPFGSLLSEPSDSSNSDPPFGSTLPDPSDLFRSDRPSRE